MGKVELEKIIEESEDKYCVFSDRETLKKYDLTIKDVEELVDKYLTDEEKYKAINLPFYGNKLKGSLVPLIKDENILMKLLEDEKISPHISEIDTKKVILSLSEENRVKIITDEKLIGKLNLNSFGLISAINCLSEESKISIVQNQELVKKIGLKNGDIANIATEISDDKTKLDLMKKYDLKYTHKTNVLSSLSDKVKEEKIKDMSENLDVYETYTVIQSMDSEYILEFYNKNKEFFENKKIQLWGIISGLNEEKQLKVMEKIDEFDIGDTDRKRILATLDRKVKEQINTENMSKEDVDVLNLKVFGKGDISKEGKISIELDKDPKIYDGLEELMYINPRDFSEEERKKLVEVCERKPDLIIKDNIGISNSTGREYVEGEKWIASVMEGINPEWSDIQKLAYIDNAIGKKISYSPDFDTEVFNVADARSLWKIIDSGKGVCNGIAQVEQYIIKQLGIESEMVAGEAHAFLKIKDIEVPTADGIKKGDTIVDPTWNLSDQRFGSMPRLFCRSYEEIRKFDINSKGIDKECHRNDEKLESATIDMDEASLRELFSSIGLTNEDKTFPIRNFLDEVGKVKEKGIEGLEKKLELLKKYYPEFATCTNSTIDTLKGTIIKPDELDANRCIINRVYQRGDEKKETQMYIYADLGEEGKVFYVVGENDKEFSKYSKEEFVEKYECYDTDLKMKEGKRPWEIEASKEIIEDKPELAQENKKIAAKRIEEER